MLIRQPDAPIEPAKYGAHGPCHAIRKSTTIAQTSDAEVIYAGAIKIYHELNPVILDIRGVRFILPKLKNTIEFFR